MKKDAFDRNSLDRIYNLLAVKGNCHKYHDELINLVSKDGRFDATAPCATFYSAMSDVIDIFIVSFLNEEVSASREDREPLRDIIENIKHMYKTTDNEFYLALAIRDCVDLFSNRIDFYISSSFIDFSVNTYSAFESWVCNLYSNLKQERGPSGRKEKEVERIIRRNIESNQVESAAIEKTAKEITERLLSYLPSAAQIDFIMSSIETKYGRNFKHDKKAIDFCRAMRNSIHNLGIHRGKSSQHEGKEGTSILLSNEQPVYSEKYVENIKLCDNLLDIYGAIISAIGIANIDIDQLVKRNPVNVI